jgi:hypothetical protein
MIRMLDLTALRTGDRPAWRFTLQLDGIALRECYARRTADGAKWVIHGPMRRDRSVGRWTNHGPQRRENGRGVPLAGFRPDLRGAIAARCCAAGKGPGGGMTPETLEQKAARLRVVGGDHGQYENIKGRCSCTAARYALRRSHATAAQMHRSQIGGVA